MNSRSRAHSFKYSENDHNLLDSKKDNDIQNLIFEIGNKDKSGVDISDCDFSEDFIEGFLRKEEIGTDFCAPVSPITNTASRL